ncbi:MAG TPA: hypothetical protein VE197_13675 [Mycobacterium sp.]|nr:hypothetical protein [Mycobacterium sp.]
MTTAGDLDVLNPATGAVLHTLASGATGDEVALTPDGHDVFFERRAGCLDEIDEVPVAGGTPQPVSAGSHPAVSPDGSKLAYMREPAQLGANTPCVNDAADNAPGALALVIRSIPSGREQTLPMSPDQVAAGLPRFVDHVSWASDSRRVVLSFPTVQDNEGWSASVLDTASATYYTSGTTVAVTAAKGSYYREAVFTPGGDLFANVVCCAGLPAQVSSTVLEIVDPQNGKELHEVAIGFTNADHTSLAADASGQWLLYLSGNDLYVSQSGSRPSVLTSGLVAADW